MRPKNYGLMSQTKRFNRPTPAQSAQYIAEIFGIDDLKKVVDIVREVKGNKDVRTEIHAIARFVRNVFLEKQLEKHGRGRLCADIDLSAWPTTLRGIAQAYINTLDSNGFEKQETASQRIKASQKYNNKVKPQSQSQSQSQPQRLDTDQADKLTKSIQKYIDEGRADSLLNAYIENENDHNGTLDDNVPSYARDGMKQANEIQLDSTIQGERVNKALGKTLVKVLDTILGRADVRAQERGFNRPSRASHFIKNCFLPVYRCNKPRKRPAFYIDASSSMQYYEHQAREVGFPCRTSAIGAFLRAQRRRISELRPRFFAFSGNDIAMEFDITKTLPVGYGGTSLGFMGAIDDKDLNVILTDAEFDYKELSMLRLWAGKHPKAEVHWVVDTELSGNRLKQALSGLKSHTVHIAKF